MVETNYRYQLEAGSKKHRCPDCNKKRFVRYVDQETGDYIRDDIGRCDREITCRYHKPPRLAEGIDLSYASYSINEPTKETIASTLPYKYVERSLVNYERNSLISWLATLPGWSWEIAMETARLYKVGTSTDGWAIFWQIDRANDVRSGKMMLYIDGNRVKNGYSQDWVHSKLKKSGHLNGFELVQCLYGLHIVDYSKPVAIVESEKTAIIASQYLPQFHWLASGMLHGINEYKLQPLRSQKITLFPDIGALELWNQKAEELSSFDFQISTLLESAASEQHNGFDLADYLIQYDLRDFSTYGWNPWTEEIFDHRRYPKSWDNIS